jgi:hypothetical protein
MPVLPLHCRWLCRLSRLVASGAGPWLDGYQEGVAICPGRLVGHVTGAVHGGTESGSLGRRAWLLILALALAEKHAKCSHSYRADLADLRALTGTDGTPVTSTDSAI